MHIVAVCDSLVEELFCWTAAQTVLMDVRASILDFRIANWVVEESFCSEAQFLEFVGSKIGHLGLAVNLDWVVHPFFWSMCKNRFLIQLHAWFAKTSSG